MKEETTRTEKLLVTRRELGQLGLGLVLAAGGVGFAARRAGAEDEQMVTEIAENATLLQALNYVPKSTTAGANCANCAVFLGGDAPKGKCALFQKGLVGAEAHCSSWSKKA